MNNVRIITPHKKIDRQIPARWGELSPEQIIFIAPRLLIPRMNIRQAKDEILAHLLNIKRRHLRRLNISQMNGLHQSIDFLYQEIDLICNPLPELRHRRVRYQGPGDKLKDMKFGQFMYADTFYLKYMKSRNIVDLNMLMATLYYKDRFDPTEIELLASRFAGVSQDKKLAVLLYFTGSRLHINRKFPVLFPQAEEGEVKSKKKSAFGWGGVLVSMVGDSPAEKDRIEQLDLYFALTYLQEQLIKADELKRKYKLK